MRIGMILDQSFPPDPRVENEAVTLISHGHEVYLFCLDYHGSHSEETIHGIQVKRYASNNFEYKLSALAYTFSLYKRRMSKKISHFIAQNNIEVLHIHDMRIAGAVFHANKKFGLKTVLDLHENRPEIMRFYPHLQKFPGKWMISLKKWKQKEEEFIRNCHQLILVTEESADEVVQRVGIEKNKITVVPNSVRKEFFNKPNIQTEILDKYQDMFVVLYLGDTHIRRGLLTAIEASKQILTQIPNFKLVIVGQNTTDSILKEKVADLGLDSCVDFEGWQDLSLFPSYISASHVCISPLYRNLHHDTTYANKIFQYMSFGKPVLVSDAKAQENIIKRANAGIVHKQKDSDDFTEKLLQLYHQPKLRMELGRNGKEFIEREFSWEIVSQDLVSMYERI